MHAGLGPAWKVTMGLSEQHRSTTWLARGGLRPTRQRLALAGLLVGDGMNRHVTAESLYGAVGLGRGVWGFRLKSTGFTLYIGG